MILKQGHTYEHMPHDGKLIAYIYRGGRCYYKDSPYSLAATQALKAAFPQYWKAIRDYGVAHPQLVPFINEDPMLIVSLVEVGKVRYLVGDGKAYVKLRNVGRMSDTYEMKFKYNVGGSYRAWGVFGQSSYTPINMSLTYSAGISVRWANNGDQQIDNLAPITSTAWHTLKIENGYVTFDGENKGRSAGHKDGFVINYPMYLFTINPANTTPTATMNGCFEYYKHTSQEGEVMEHCVPCQHQGEAGMLDVVNATFHHNANTEGSFTIQITDKA